MKPVTISEILQVAPDSSPAVIVPELGVRVTYASLRSQVLAMADALAAAGIRGGDRVALALPNGLPAIVCFLAATIAGTAAPLNLAYRHDEFCFFLEDTAARALICLPEGSPQARCAAAERRIPVFSAEMDGSGVVRLAGTPGQGSATAPSQEDTALILHTSGSTGRPKRVPLRHINLACSAENIVKTFGLSPHDVALCAMPLFHVHGLVASVLSTLLSGGTVVVPGKFNPLGFSRLIREHGVTWCTAVPTIHQLLLARAGKQRPSGASSLRFLRSASAPLPPHVMVEVQNLFEVPLLEAYGMTEAAHQMASNPLPPMPRKPGSVGLPTGLQISLMDEYGNHVERGHRGEVVIQGPNVFSGYENNPEANATAFVDGWFRTGDQGFMDSAGYLHLTGRIKELINRAGEKIAPRHIDEVLLTHPAVAEAVTFGMPHPTLGEEVAAAVVLREPETEAALLKYCREHLADFEAPKKLYIVKDIPRTATGKIQRGAVAAALTKTEAA